MPGYKLQNSLLSQKDEIVFPLEKANYLTQMVTPVTRYSQDELCVTNGAVESSYVSTSYYLANIWNGLYLLSCIKGEISLSLYLLVDCL